MSSQDDPRAAGGGDRPPTEEELRAAYEAELKRIRVEDVIFQTIVSLINLGGRRTGIAPDTEAERDLEQVRLAIEGVRALMPLVEPQLGPQAGTLRDAVSQLQMAYAQLAGAAGAPEAGAPEPGAAGGGPEAPGPGADEQRPPEGAEPPPQGAPGEPGPAQRSGRLWIPGQ